MTRAMWEALRLRTEDLPSSARLLLLRGAGADFTSGFDLSELADLPVAEVDRAFAVMERAIAAIERLPIPVLALLDGYVLGGGLELALAADIRIATERARLGMPVARLGIMLSRNFARRLVNDLGHSRTKDLLFTGRLLDGEEARMYGLVNTVEESTVAYDRALSTARTIVAHFPNAIRQAKSAVESVAISPDGDEAPYYVEPEDFKEAVQRFRRPP